MKNKTVFLLLMFFLSGCTITNSYDAYSGKVIDTETKAPIEGAAVLVVYLTEQYGLAGAVSHFADTQEVLTDKNGEFKIPTKRIITFRVLSGWERYPYFYIFKPGYGCYPNHKDVKPMFVPNGALPSNRLVIIELPKLINRDERVANLPSPIIDVPKEKQWQYVELISQEDKFIGIKSR